MGLFDDIPLLEKRGLFDDLPTVNPTPTLPVAPSVAVPPMAATPQPQLPQSAPVTALPVGVPSPAPLGEPQPPISNMFADIPQVAPPVTPQPVDPLVSELQRQLEVAPPALRPQIEARLGEVLGQMQAESVPPVVGPFDDESIGDLLGRRGSQFMRGLTETIASLPEAAAIISTRADQSRTEGAAGFGDERQETMRQMQERLADPALDEPTRAFIEQNLADMTEGQPVIEGIASEPVVPAAERPIFERGQELRDASLEKFGTPDPRDDAFWGKVAEGAGNVTGMAAASTAGAVVGGPPAALAVGGASGSSMNSSALYREALQTGASEETALDAARWGRVIGATEAIPISRALQLLPPRLRKEVADPILRRFADIAQSSGEEAAQEYLAGFANNIVAQQLYDPQRGWTEGLADDALVGAVLGAGLGAIGTLANPDSPPPERSNPPAMAAPIIPEGSGDAPNEPQESNQTPTPVQPDIEMGSEGNAPVSQAGGDDPAGPPAPPAVSEGGADADAPGQPGTALTPEPQTPEAPPAPAGNTERQATVFTPENEPVNVEYQVVEADTVLTSDQQGFDQTAQPRNREGNANSEMQIERIANAPNFSRLNRAPETDRGAPVVGADGLVESGNGRVMGLRRAYERGTIAEYRAALEAAYPEAAGMKNPIVVARRLSEVNREDFAYQSNKPATQAMSATEEARAEARLVDKDILGLYRGGPVTSAANRDMVRAFIGKLPQSDQNRLLTPEGGLSIEGQRRVQSAVFSRAYGDERLLTRMAESIDDDMKGITGVLTDLAPRVAQMRDLMDRSQVAKEGDFIPALIEAVEQIANFRSTGQDLAGFRAQTDAFAEPLSPDVQDLMDIMFNPAGTRLASKASIADFIETAIAEAEKQDTTVETMPGIEPPRVKPAAEIVSNARQKAEAEPEQNSLLDRETNTRERSNQRRQETRRTANDEGGQATAGTVQDAAARVGRRPPGKLSPQFLDFSYTNKASVFAHAFRDAGIDPEKGVLMPVEQQLDMVKKAVEKRFGVNVEIPTVAVRKRNLAGRMVSEQRTSLQTRKALDQLLNAYRQLQMLAHVMAMPEQAIGLPIDGKPITISLVGKRMLRGALGQFSWGGNKRTITLPDMSNSFAHEWGHALDHWLGAQSDQPMLKDMLTRGMAGRGVTPPLSPKHAITDAFAHVMWSMFGDSSAAGSIVLKLQVEGAQIGPDGKPTPKAKRAQRAYADIRAGKTPPREYWSDYFKTSQAFDNQVDGGGYFTDPAEMFARAFEAMVGAEVAKVSDQPQAFLSKGEWAYSDTTDARAALTFPKKVDLQQFTLAMVNLQHAMSRLNLHGNGPAAKAPEAMDIMSTRSLLKRPTEGLGGLTRKEMSEWGRTLDAMADLPAGMRQGMTNFGEGVDKIYSQAIRTGAATLFAVADRQENPKAREALTNIAKSVGKRPGKGKETTSIWEETVRMKSGVRINQLDGAVKKALKGLKARRLRPSDLSTLRLLLGGEKVANAERALITLASDMRLILNDIWYDLQRAGIQVGYASNYLPHIYDAEAAAADPTKFRAKAKQVYDLMFTREIVDNDDTEGQIKDMNSIINGLRGASNAMPDGGRDPAPRLSDDNEATITQWRKARSRLTSLESQQKKSDDPDKFADRIAEQYEVVAEAYHEVMEILRDRWSEYSAEKWSIAMRTGELNDFGSIGPTANFLQGRVLPNEAGIIMQDFMHQNPIEMVTNYAFTATKRAEYASLFGADNSKLKNMLDAAEGASKQDIETVKMGVNAATGRIQSSGSGYQTFKTTTFTIGNMSLLTLASMSSIAEPLTAGLRSGQSRDSLRAIVETISNLVRLKRHRELKELARTIGLIMPYATDTLMQNRLGADVMQNREGLQNTLGRFFVLNGLTPLTHYQRAMMVPVANAVILRHLRASVEGRRGIYGAVRDKISGEVGAHSNGELNELGIVEADRADLLEWLDSVGGMPSPEDLFGPDGNMHKAAEIWSRAAYRFSTETIQDTLKSDRTFLANHPDHSAMYGIMSFIDAFTRNVIWRTLERGINEGDGKAKAGAKMATNAAMATLPIGILAVGQILTGIIREAIFNPEKMQEIADDEEQDLTEWLIKRGIARTGLFGRFDPVVNLFTGIRYGTDPTSIFAGPYAAYFLNNFGQMIAAETGRNSANTNTAEHSALTSVYQAMVKPAGVALLSSLPQGPISINMARAGLGYLSSRSTERDFADALVGEKGAKHVGDPPWWERGE